MGSEHNGQPDPQQSGGEAFAGLGLQGMISGLGFGQQQDGTVLVAVRMDLLMTPAAAAQLGQDLLRHAEQAAQVAAGPQLVLPSDEELEVIRRSR